MKAIFGIMVFLLSLWIVLEIVKARRRGKIRKLKNRPFPAEWLALLRHNVPLYDKLPKTLQKELLSDTQVFIGTKRFEGCGGLEITDEIRVTIAAQACMLLLNRDDNCYPGLQSIVVYPTTYDGSKALLFGDPDSEKQYRYGESWGLGTVVLAWDAVLRGSMDVSDGENVVLHEFAHQLDQEDGETDGAPILDQRSHYVTWARTLDGEFERLHKAMEEGEDSLLNEYGATNYAEFFSVATETFFEKPRQLLKKHPELYAELKRYYRVDPAQWEDAQFMKAENGAV